MEELAATQKLGGATCLAEVRRWYNGYRFLAFLLPDYRGQKRDHGDFHIGMFSKALEAGDVDALMVVFYLVFTLLGQ